MARMKKSRQNDPSYRTHRSNAPDTQLRIPIGSVTPSSTLKELDVPRIMSGVNHRLYRQHGCYRVKVDMLTSGPVGDVKVYALSNAWYVKRAIQMAKQVYDKAMDEERALGRQARWHDFRINPNLAAHDDMVQAISLTPGAAPTLATHPGEWTYSSIEDTAGTEQQFILPSGGSTTGYNILFEYDKTGNADVAPASSANLGAYDGADGTIEAENLNQLINDGNLPPYNNTDLLADVFVQVGSLYRDATGSQRLSTGYFDAPLGMVFLVYPTPDANLTLELECKSGKYKGVHMEAY
jgi:hypothetical protein